jgi:hypothetical protein
MSPRHSLWSVVSLMALMALAVLALGAGPDPIRDALPTPLRAVAPPADAIFSDDFSHGLDRWKPDRDGVWSIRHGMLRADLPDGKQERSFIYAGDDGWSDYAVDLDVCMMRGVDKGVVVRVEGNTGIGVDLRGPGYQDVVANRREWRLGRASMANANGTWHHLRVEARGHTYKVLVNGDLKLDLYDGRKSLPTGRIALPAYTGGVGECTVYYDNVVVTPLPPASASNAFE